MIKNINGVVFEVITPKQPVEINKGRIENYMHIFHKYVKPSMTKYNIWKNWLDWCIATDGIKSFFISSYNCNFFTISGLYEDIDGTLYNIRITRAHNYLIRVDGVV